MIASAAGKVIISLLVTLSNGQQYAVQTWAPEDAKQLHTEWDTCRDLARDLEVAGRGTRAAVATGLKAECKVEPVQQPSPAQGQPASLQTISF